MDSDVKQKSENYSLMHKDINNVRNNGYVQLTSLKEGDEGEIAVIRAGRAATQRLNEMGLVPETRIKVLRKGALKGPIEIGVRNSRLIIGAGLASKIYIRII